MQTLPERAKDLFLNTYPIQPVAMERGEGCWLYDTDGKKYLDFAAGIAVASLGHAHPAIIRALEEQSRKFMICPASYMTAPRVECAQLLVDHSCFDRVFFCNSGAEAIEAALKLARKWAHENRSPECKDIIAFKRSFHGRTYGAASVTGKAPHQPYFAPHLPGVSFGEFNDIESVRALVTDRTCAIILEPVQGEGGINPAKPDFLNALRALCDEAGIVLIFDEIQAGIGRIGTLFAYQHFGVEPDLAAIAKGMGGGFPVGAMLAKEKFAGAFRPGDHGTTYGGNPLACAVALAVLSEISKPAFLKNVRSTGTYFIDRLKKLQKKNKRIIDVRGIGLLVGVDVKGDIKALLSALRDSGLLATQAGDKTLRLTPPLIAGKDEVDKTVELIGAALAG